MDYDKLETLATEMIDSLLNGLAHENLSKQEFAIMVQYLKDILDDRTTYLFRQP